MDKISFYNKQYKRFTGGHGQWREKIIKSRMKIILQNIPPLRRNSKILEVGCDEGLLIKMLERQYDVIGYGVEINRQAVSLANHPRITQGKAEELKFDDDFFDIVIASHLIEHLPQPKVFLKEACRVLRTGGQLVLVYPWEIFPGMTVIPDLIKSRQSLKLMKEIHPRCLNPAALQELTHDLPLRVKKSKLFWGFPYTVPQYLNVFEKVPTS